MGRAWPPCSRGQDIEIHPRSASARRKAREWAPEPYPASVPSSGKAAGGCARRNSRTSRANASSSAEKLKSRATSSPRLRRPGVEDAAGEHARALVAFGRRLVAVGQADELLAPAVGEEGRPGGD